jgi:mRNA-degrading endonuclease RelE of RelBE toxin-antitoxin system
VAYDLDFSTSAAGDLEKLVKHNPALAVQLIVEHCPAIARDPQAAGEKKQGDLAGLRAYGFTFRGVAYRIVYEVDESRQRAIILAIGVHDVAYRRARNR